VAARTRTLIPTTELSTPVKRQSSRAPYGGTGWLISETLAAGLAFGEQLWLGRDANVGRVAERAAGELGIAIHLLDRR
jgi:hypothetical protein